MNSLTKFRPFLLLLFGLLVGLLYSCKHESDPDYVEVGVVIVSNKSCTLDLVHGGQAGSYGFVADDAQIFRFREEHEKCVIRIRIPSVEGGVSVRVNGIAINQNDGNEHLIVVVVSVKDARVESFSESE